MERYWELDGVVYEFPFDVEEVIVNDDPDLTSINAGDSVYFRMNDGVEFTVSSEDLPSDVVYWLEEVLYPS